MSRPLGVALVGCGRAAGLHAGALAQLPGLRLAALTDVDPGRCRALADRLDPRPACHPDVGTLLADPAVDVVGVCVPPAEHAAVAGAALAAGRHVLVEKPIAVSLEDADVLVAEAEGRGVIATMGFNLRWHRQVLAAGEALRRGDLGRVHLLRTQWTAGPGAVVATGAWRRRREEGGGVLFELGSHHADLWRHLLGDEVVACGTVATFSGGVEEDAVVTARSRAGVLVTSTFSQASSDSNELELVGERGRLQLGLFRGDGPRLHPLGREGGGVRARAAEGARLLTDLPRQARVARRGGDYLMSFVTEWAALERAVRGEPVALPTLHDGREALRLVLAAREQAAAS